MQQLPYGIGIETSMSMEAAEAAIRDALAEEGFGILTEIDVAATMKQKLDIDRTPYKILGACNPPLANRALDADEQIGLLLPCNVAVYRSAETTVIAAMEPSLMASMSSGGELNEVAAEARARIIRALEHVEAAAGS
jgi:uncharacterized protein (DUF302 family)